MEALRGKEFIDKYKLAIDFHKIIFARSEQTFNKIDSKTS